MVTQNLEKQDKEEKPVPGPDLQCRIKFEKELQNGEKDVIPYEKKYYALLSRCETIKQSNERLVNRLYHVKKLIRRYRKQRKFLTNRLDLYNDDYRNVFSSMFTEVFGDSSPARLSHDANLTQVATNPPLIEPKLEQGT